MLCFLCCANSSFIRHTYQQFSLEVDEEQACMDNALIILHGMLWNHCIFVEHLIYVAKKCIEIKTESSQYSGFGSLLSKTFLLFKHLCNVNISLLLTFLYFEYLLIIHSKYLFTFKSNQSLKALSQNLSLSNLLYQVSQKKLLTASRSQTNFFS